MDEQHAQNMLARFGPMDALLDDLVKHGKVADLLALPESIFNVAMEQLRRAHLEQRGYRFQDPAACESCEG